MSEKKTMVALDCGNSSFRVVLGNYQNGKMESTVVNQIPNNMIRIGEFYYWDLLCIYHEFKMSLKQIVKKGVQIDSIGICTWGVDFALFDSEGNMLSNPLSYRNSIGEQELSQVGEEKRQDLFYETGILCDKINSVYMLSGMRKHFGSILESAESLLMVPDILNFFLTGKMVNEPSELSTTQLLDVKTRKINQKVCDMFGIPVKYFREQGVHGERIGFVRKDILSEIGADYDIPVICVPSHDTASAVAAVPAMEKRFGFISCGTWSLIGTELEEPVCTQDVIDAGLTNELGAFGKITMLKNSAGMFIVNQLKKEYDFFNGIKASWNEITQLAETCTQRCVMDLNDLRFFNPENMSEAVWDYLKETGQTTGEMEWAVLFRAFYESLACCYSLTIYDIERVTGHCLEKVYIVGGGAASRILLDLTARYMGKPVVVCYGESTSMGNLAVQLKYFHGEFGLEDLREIIGKSYRTEEIVRASDKTEMLERYMKLTGRRE